MELSRRRLLQVLTAVTGAAALPLMPALSQVAPERLTRRASEFLYPGRLRPLSIDEVRRPSTWEG